jgi:hypothetical protein
MALSPLLVSAASFFEAEPAAVSLTAEVDGAFVAVVRTDGGAAAVGTFSTEEAALAALEAFGSREAIRTLMADFAEHAAGEHEDGIVIDCAVCRVEAAALGMTLPALEVTK